MRAAAGPYERWIREEFGPLARRLGFSGRGPTFRRRVDGNWIVFNLERRPIDPREVALVHDDPRVEFRVNIGVVSSAARPEWMPPRETGGPRVHEATIRGWDPLLEPGDPMWPWHVFDAGDPSANARLAIRLREGVERALARLREGSSDRAILDQRLSVAGRLENLSPGAVEELLALADSAGDRRVRDEIVAALKRPRVREPELDALRGGWQPPIGRLWKMPRPRRFLERRLTRLLADARAKKVVRRRIAVADLSGWQPRPEVIAAVRDALADEDAYVRSEAAAGLGQLGDGEGATWDRVLELCGDPQGDGLLLGTAVVLLERLDPSLRRAAASDALARLARLHPGWTRDLEGFKTQLG